MCYVDSTMPATIVTKKRYPEKEVGAIWPAALVPPAAVVPFLNLASAYLSSVTFLQPDFHLRQGSVDVNGPIIAYSNQRMVQCVVAPIPQQAINICAIVIVITPALAVLLA